MINRLYDNDEKLYNMKTIWYENYMIQRLYNNKII